MSGSATSTPTTLRHALPAGVACVQNGYGLVDRAAEPVLRLCREHDVAWVPYFPLGSGFAGLPEVADRPEVREVAARLGATPAQVGPAWVLTRSPRAMLIPGTRDLAHLAENLAAGDLVLDPESLLAPER
ncbi:aldo/keto reductase [Saccharopolyspora sp. NPDC047091]|uniref:aldo/keto reductase n=1 Tax=Saccharopolyspora sp. NPDC047091 TaxID=3155924 RepID=UPI0033E2553B